MKNLHKKLIFFSVSFILSINLSFADNMADADKMLQKANIVSIEDAKFEYILNARNIYEKEVKENPENINALIGLSKTFQLTQNRNEAKLYILQAYNLEPYNPKVQKEMGDFYYNFQEYNTALEYYKLALASGLLKDFETNLQVAKCYEKLGDNQNTELYYQICNHVKGGSKNVSKKLNQIESAKHEKQISNNKDLKAQKEPKYKYLFKNKPVSEEEKTQNEAENLINQINNL